MERPGSEDDLLSGHGWSILSFHFVRCDTVIIIIIIIMAL